MLVKVRRVLLKGMSVTTDVTASLLISLNVLR